MSSSKSSLLTLDACAVRLAQPILTLLMNAIGNPTPNPPMCPHLGVRGLEGYRGFRGSGGEGGRIVKVVFQTSRLRHKKQSFFAVLELSFVLRHGRRSPSFRPKQDFQPKQSCRNFGSLNTRNHRSVSKKVCKSGFTRVAVAVAEIRSFENCFPLFHERS